MLSDVRGVAAMSIDVEDWFQVENLKGAIARNTWDSRELRVERNVDRMLGRLDDAGVRSTFFILGWIAEQAPTLIKRIAAQGHEIACHGYGHDLLPQLTPQTFGEDLDRARGLLQELTGQPVVGYRAPSFSITEWAIDVLAEHGMRYDSSAFPTVAHDRYGKLAGIRADTPIAELRPGFHEICVSCLQVGKRGVPWGGGGYFRFMPYPIFKQGVGWILRSGAPYVFYIHPWEIDAEQPRVEGLPPSYRFRHYVNLARCEDRFRQLLADFQWTTLDQLLGRYTGRAAA